MGGVGASVLGSTGIVVSLVTSMSCARMVANRMWLGTDEVPSLPNHTRMDHV